MWLLINHRSSITDIYRFYSTNFIDSSNNKSFRRLVTPEAGEVAPPKTSEVAPYTSEAAQYTSEAAQYKSEVAPYTS